MRFSIVSLILGASMVGAFSPSQQQQRLSGSTILFSSTEEVAEAATNTDEPLDPKEIVKLFGRLAEKYIMLDESGGMCCYSACSDCEFRLPDGGYKMADQSSARPKWIPVYEQREFEGLGKSHTAKWKTDIFEKNMSLFVTKDEFVTLVTDMDFVPPLGGPYLSASAGKELDSNDAAERLFDVLSAGKEKLTRHKMSLGLKEIANGEQGITWAMFSAALSS